MGCDQGTQQNEAVGAGGAIQVVGQSPVAGQQLASDGVIEIVFNRYLLPASVTRQTFALHDTSPSGPLAAPPSVAYDPVARIVTVTPAPNSLMVDRDEVLVIDSNALRAIDGASLAPGQPTVFNFPVVAGDGGAVPVVPQVDYCRDINPILSSCGSCHFPSPSTNYEGLDLNTPANVAATAIGKTAHESNTGPRSTPEPPGAVFGVDMPVIDPGDSPVGGGNPSHSWLMYKVLMSQPPPMSGYTYTSCEGGTYNPTDVTRLHAAAQPAFSDEAHDTERANLANMIPGREMPYPFTSAEFTGGVNPNALTVDELERVQLWIAGGPNGLDGGADAATYLPSGLCGCVQ